jgi:hypothetical protein
LTIPSGESFILGDGVSLVVDEGGTLVNNGTIENKRGSKIVNKGTINNGGRITGRGAIYSDKPIAGVPAVSPLNGIDVVETVDLSDLIICDDQNVTAVTAKRVSQDYAVDTGIADSAFELRDGAVFVTPKAIEDGLGGNEKVDEILPLPVFKATVEANKVALVTFKTTLNAFAGRDAGELSFLKLTKSGTVSLPRAASLKTIKAGEFALTDESLNPIGDQIESGKEYYISVAVQDNDGNLDWDDTATIIVDPGAVAVTSNASSGGGCNAGAGAFGVFIALACLAGMRKKRG